MIKMEFWYIHGIGVYEGITSLKIDKVKKDFLKINYNGSECLYIPPDQLDRKSVV